MGARRKDNGAGVAVWHQKIPKKGAETKGSGGSTKISRTSFWGERGCLEGGKTFMLDDVTSNSIMQCGM